MRIFPALVTAILLAAAPSLAIAAAAGSAVGVKQQAGAAIDGETRTLVVGADLFIGDLVETGPRGQVQILFGDNTELVVGPNSALTIEDYLIRNDGTPGKLAVDVLSGAFRFATGDSAKNRYTIGTPTGTIGVRGTEFDGWVGGDGIGYVIRHGGIVDICLDGKLDCDVIDEICEVGKIGVTETETLGDSRQSEGDERQTYKRWFLYTENQGPLLREFWFANARDCLNSAPDVPDNSDSGDLNDEDNNNDGGDPTDPSSEPPPTSSEPPPTSSEPPPTSSEPPPCVPGNRICP